ncbi:phosphoserine phosphatase SerB [Amaricoccus macauensis]|uniref:phosphoserine phosphatase SerB n=1 Tax=Amaricoccus macauensis TaxID=57001 RepID=UPI003C7C97ED
MAETKLLVLTHADDVRDDDVAAMAARMRDAGLEPSEPARLAGTAIRIPFRGTLPEGMKPADLTGGRDLDANVVPANVRFRMLIADMDSTMIAVECIDELADFAGVKDRVADITERAMRGELDFEAALIERVGLLKGLPEADLAACFEERVKLNPGARQLVQTVNAEGGMTVLVSGGFTYFSSRVAEQTGFQIHRANELLFEDGRLTGDVARPILGRASKLEMLNAVCAEKGISTKEVIAIGDGANDLSMIEAAGLGVAYHAKPALREAADATLDVSDLTAVLALQGIPEANWQT